MSTATSTDTTDWTPPDGGHWRRDFRLAEWLPSPVSPSFATWALPCIEEGFAAAGRDELGGLTLARPMHVIVNGWYFTNDPKVSGLLTALFRHPRKLIGSAVGMATFGGHPERVLRWMAEPSRALYGEQLLPHHRDRIHDAAARVETATTTELIELIDELCTSTGSLMTAMTQALGFAGKAEFALASFHAKHLRDQVDAPYLDLLAGLVTPAPPPPHAVYSLDWVEPTVGERAADPAPSGSSGSDAAHASLVARRRAAEVAARTVLGGKERTRFDELLHLAQEWVPVRDSMVTEFTEAWPTLRRAGLRLGDHLAARGLIGAADDVWFLERDEIRAVVDGQPLPAVDVPARRARREAQAQVTPPLGIGKPSGPWRHMDRYLGVFQPPAEPSTVRGIGTSSGVATGRVCIVRSLDDFDSFADGDVLVAPVTTPAWTSLFGRAAAVVTDGGSPFAHAAVVAREYGIPAVVGTEDATARLHTGQTVTVDGAAGTVTIT